MMLQTTQPPSCHPEPGMCRGSPQSGDPSLALLPVATLWSQDRRRVGTHAAESPWSWLTPELQRDPPSNRLQSSFSVASASGDVVSAVERWAPSGLRRLQSLFGFYLQGLWASATAALLQEEALNEEPVASKPQKAHLQEACRCPPRPCHPRKLPRSQLGSGGAAGAGRAQARGFRP